MTSERQSAEWGVRAVKGPFKRLTVPLPADSYERLRIIAICVHLCSFRTRFVGLNQICIIYAEDSAEAQPCVVQLYSELGSEQN